MTALSANSAFGYDAFFPGSVFSMITDVRVSDPRVIEKAAGRRKKRDRLTVDGKLAILAADHPAGGSQSQETTPQSWETATATFPGFSES